MSVIRTNSAIYVIRLYYIKMETGVQTTAENLGKVSRPAEVAKKKATFNYRIVGGSTVLHSYPWICSLRSKSTNKHFCMGMLIDELWVLTAKHCLNANNDPVVWIGGLHVDKEEEFLVRNVKKVYMHPKLDIALLELTLKVKDRSVVNINHNPDIPPGTVATAIGWGRLREGGLPAETLQQVDLPVVDNRRCKAAMGIEYEPAYEMCAGVSEGGKDACSGDSGGPLIIFKNEADVTTQFVIGITSWGSGCGKPGKYGAWVKVSEFVDFLKQHISHINTYDAIDELALQHLYDLPEAKEAGSKPMHAREPGTVRNALTLPRADTGADVSMVVTLAGGKTFRCECTPVDTSSSGSVTKKLITPLLEKFTHLTTTGMFTRNTVFISSLAVMLVVLIVLACVMIKSRT
jgi:hypothetical protein